MVILSVSYLNDGTDKLDLIFDMIKKFNLILYSMNLIEKWLISKDNTRLKKLNYANWQQFMKIIEECYFCIGIYGAFTFQSFNLNIPSYGLGVCKFTMLNSVISNSPLLRVFWQQRWLTELEQWVPSVFFPVPLFNKGLVAQPVVGFDYALPDIFVLFLGQL